MIAAKYYPFFTNSLQKIFKENLKNKFDIEKVKGYYSKYPQYLVDRIVAENTPTCTDALNPRMLEQNWEEVLSIANSLPSSEQMVAWLSELNGYYDYHQLGLTEESCLEAIRICCYIRNRFTMLRIVCDFETYQFNTLLI